MIWGVWQILRFAQNDRLRAVQNDRLRAVRNDRLRAVQNDRLRVVRNDSVRVWQSGRRGICSGREECGSIRNGLWRTVPGP